MAPTRQLLRVSATDTSRCRQDIGLWNVRHPLEDMAVEPKRHGRITVSHSLEPELVVIPSRRRTMFLAMSSAWGSWRRTKLVLAALCD